MMNIKEILELPEKRRIKTLEAFIKEHRHKYYNDIPEISDKEYDRLEKELKKLVPNHKLFEQVGSKPKRNKIKFPHNIVIGSLKNITAKEIKNLKRWQDDIIASPKLDGLSGLLQYSDGKLIMAATRGDGKIGESVLDKALSIDSIPKVISNLPKSKKKSEVLVRGEFVYAGELIEKYKTKRGAASGILLRHDEENLNKIMFIAHNLVTHPKPKQTYLMRLRQMETMGFVIVDHFLIDFISIKSKERREAVIESLSSILEKRTNYPYLIDGVVLTKNLSEIENVALPKYSVAFKPENIPVETTVTEIEWRVGRTGKITPVVHVDAININDTEIDSPTGHNYRWILDKGIGVGARVAVIYSKDVIPYISDVIKKAKVIKPARCPECKKPIVIGNVDLVCTNKECPGMKYNKLTYFLTTLGAENISDKTLRSLGLNNIKSIYNAKETEIAIHPGFGETKAKTIKKEVEKTLNVYPYQLLAAFGIPLIGLKTAAKICAKAKDFSEIFETKFKEKLVGIPGIGTAVINSFATNILNYKDDYEFLLTKGLKLKKRNPKSIKLKDKTFQFTGKFSTPRKNLEQLVVNNGGQIMPVSKNLSYLVVANKNTISAKMKKATAYNVKTITEKEFKEML